MMAINHHVCGRQDDANFGTEISRKPLLILEPTFHLWRFFRKMKVIYGETADSEEY